MLEQLYILPILLFSVVIHEVAHGWMALKLGDPTAKQMGRLTLNPVPHIDPIGSILVPLFSLFVAGRVFIAWAKPVPVNPFNFSDYRRDDILVSIVGPISNLIVALGCTIMFILVALLGQVVPINNPVVEEAFSFLFKMFAGGITLNVVLAVFNLIPIPPLDGSHVVAAMLPDSLSEQYQRLGFYGIFIVIIIMRWQPFSMLFSSIISVLSYPYFMLIQLVVQ
ncbi:MAG: site-2 protease family protein [Ignavibacteriales bacterium]|nr:site-2 protease family protein [Ignavibacteriales bacterium]